MIIQKKCLFSNNTPETMTRQHTQKHLREISKQYYEDNKERLLKNESRLF